MRLWTLSRPCMRQSRLSDLYPPIAFAAGRSPVAWEPGSLAHLGSSINFGALGLLAASPALARLGLHPRCTSVAIFHVGPAAAETGRPQPSEPTTGFTDFAAAMQPFLGWRVAECILAAACLSTAQNDR
jgi:hypothetical protein